MIGETILTLGIVAISGMLLLLLVAFLLDKDKLIDIAGVMCIATCVILVAVIGIGSIWGII